jgi:hypothetical protein
MGRAIASAYKGVNAAQNADGTEPAEGTERSAQRVPRANTSFTAPSVGGLGELIMHRLITSPLFLVPFVWGCGGSFPPPSQRLADAQSAERSARELGANDEPEAQLSLRLAQEKIARAQKAMTQGENEQANGLLMRAKADAELAVAQTRAKSAEVEGQVAVDDSAEQKATNLGQGAVK